MFTSTERHCQKRTNADGKSLFEAGQTKRGSRSKVIIWGTPVVLKISTAPSRTVSALKFGFTVAATTIDVPTSTTLNVSTTCACLPSPLGSGGTLLTSLKSICQLL